MKIIKTLVLAFFFISSNNNVKAEKPFNINNNLDKININNKVYKNAQLFNELFRKFKNNTIDDSSLKLLFKNYHHGFNDYWPFLNSLNNINSNNQSLSCMNELLDNYSKDFLLKKYITKYCNNRIFKKLDVIAKYDQKQFKKVTDYLQKFFGYYNTKSRRKKTIHFIKSIKNKRKRIYLSNALTQYFLTNEIAPTKDLKEFITINSHMFSLINKNKLQYNNLIELWETKIVKLLRKSYNLKNNSSKVLLISKTYQEVRAILKRTKGNFSADFVYSKIIPFSMYLVRNNLHYEARKLLDILKNDYPIPHDHFQEYTFSYLWSYISNEKYKSVLNYCSAFDLLKKLDQLGSRNLYWIAHSFDKLNKKNSTKKYLKYIIKNHPISFYSIIARQELSKSQSQRSIASLTTNLYQLNDRSDHILVTTSIFDQIARIKSWLKLKSSVMLNIETTFLLKKYAEFIDTTNIKEKKYHLNRFYYALSSLNQDHFNYLQSFKVVYRGLNKGSIDLDYNYMKLLFPLPYTNLIAGLKNTADPILLISLIRQESSFDPFARSRVGALGLMQLMPYTAKRMSRKVTKKDLLNPITNINVGVKYLKLLLRKYDNNLLYTLSAYNAGETNLNSWREEYFKTADFLTNLESVPYSETKKYVKLIYRNMYFYNKINKLENGLLTKKTTSQTLGFKN